MDMTDVRLLLDYNRWGNARILDTAAKLTDEQFRAPAEGPHGGLRGTLVHLLFAEQVWRMRWQGVPLHDQPRLNPEEFPTPAALRARWMEEDTALADFIARLTDRTLKSEMKYTSTEGGRHTRVLRGTMAHFVNHGTQHRAEARRRSSPSSVTRPATSI